MWCSDMLGLHNSSYTTQFQILTGVMFTERYFHSYNNYTIRVYMMAILLFLMMSI